MNTEQGYESFQNILFLMHEDSPEQNIGVHRKNE